MPQNLARTVFQARLSTALKLNRCGSCDHVGAAIQLVQGCHSCQVNVLRDGSLLDQDFSACAAQRDSPHEKCSDNAPRWRHGNVNARLYADGNGRPDRTKSRKELPHKRQILQVIQTLNNQVPHLRLQQKCLWLNNRTNLWKANPSCNYCGKATDATLSVTNSMPNPPNEMSEELSETRICQVKTIRIDTISLAFSAKCA